MSPTHAPTPCVEQGCYRLSTYKGRCAECNRLKGGGRVAYDQRRGSARDRGYDKAWEKRRKAWLQLEPFCRTCGKPGNHVDHVIPHRKVKWLFDLKGNLQTLCERHHQNKTAAERTIPIGMMYPLDLPKAPHYRPTRLTCGPKAAPHDLEDFVDGHVLTYEVRNELLRVQLSDRTHVPLLLDLPAPRTAERAFWSYVLDCPAELQEPPIEWAVDGSPSEWWADFMLDARAEVAIESRLS